jgi:hypothetical protein
MPITREPDFPTEAAQLMASFDKCAKGHTINIVLSASVEMLAASIHRYLTAAGQDNPLVVASYARAVCDGVIKSVKDNIRRKPQPTDIPVRGQ